MSPISSRKMVPRSASVKRPMRFSVAPVKGDKVNRRIVLPANVPDVAKVQIWCAFAETLLGEAEFASPVK